MLHVTRSTTAAALVAALGLAACGDDDRLTRDQYTAELQPAVEQISDGFGTVFARIGRAEETDRVPAAALRQLSEAAARERSVAERLAGLEPPESLASLNERLVAGARRQADDLERLARSQGTVTVAQVADAIEEGASVGPLRELGERGVVAPPGADGH
jgi:hypothetical protein